MIVYSATKQEFNDDVIMNKISDKILSQLRLKKVSGGELAEYRSWQNSLVFMRNVIDDTDIPNESAIAIEYQIPRTSKRVDFIIAGADSNNHNNVVVVELKQWEKAEIVADEMKHSVKAFTGGANRIVSHPSYQAYSYSVFIRNSSEYVQDEDIGLIPCAYLHNYNPKHAGVLNDRIYRSWYEEAPFLSRIKLQNLEPLSKSIFH